MIKLTAANGWVAKDEHGIQFPWYTSGMLKVLDKMDLKGKKVFEYGVGYSTLWYRSRGALTAGVDSNHEWANMVGVPFTIERDKYIHEAYDYTYCPRKINQEYVRVFDIISIDGIYRDECTEHALLALRPGGMLIIDNWMQPSVEPNEWTKTLELTKGMKSEVFAQEGHPDWKTIYFIKP